MLGDTCSLDSAAIFLNYWALRYIQVFLCNIFSCSSQSSRRANEYINATKALAAGKGLDAGNSTAYFYGVLLNVIRDLIIAAN